MDDFEEAIIKLHQNPITFEQYENQNNYGVFEVKKFRSIIYENEDETEQVLKRGADAKDDLSLLSSINECRLAAKKKPIGLQQLRNNDADIEEEISDILKKYDTGHKKGNVRVERPKEDRTDRLPVGRSNDLFKKSTSKTKISALTSKK